MNAAPLDTLRQAAIAREPDRYFAATLAPEARRYDLIALTAFAAELANIPTQVREPLAGEIRLQWWRDALAEKVISQPREIPLPLPCGTRSHVIAYQWRSSMA